MAWLEIKDFAQISLHSVYKILIEAQGAAIMKLKPDNIVSDAYRAATSVVREIMPGLMQYLTKSDGTWMRLEFKETGLDITIDNGSKVKAGMIFNVALGFHELPSITDNPRN
ncbi:hypothetical protein CCACVL1_02596 [Corchorus capsularis]|uniref:FACT complex subunit n=1 Tax=Corchorus capsularis TaxID=210143 RepID=A0A1R3K7L4_COCAP|nr:hypothetical protein CCACVL1_02596 [Corchorus capsularis]